MLKRALKVIKKCLLRDLRTKKPSPVTQSTQIVYHLEVVEDSFSWLKSNKKQVADYVCKTVDSRRGLKFTLAKN